MPSDVTSPWGFLATYGVQLYGGLRRVLSPNPRLVAPIPRDPATGKPYHLPTSDESGAPRNAPAPTPTPTPTTVSPYETRVIDEPKRLSGRKAKRVGKARMALRLFGMWYDDLPEPVRAGIEYAGNNPSGMPGVVKLPKNLRPPPAMGSKGAQRGFVAPELVPLIANPPVRAPTRGPTPRTLPMLPFEPAPQMQPQPARTPVAPARPGVEPRPTAPEVDTQGYLNAPDAEQYLRRIPAAEPVYPGSRPAPTTTSPSRVPGPSGPSTAKPGKTGSRASVARANVGSIVLSAGPLLADAIGRREGRSANPFAPAQSIGRATPATGRVPAPALQTLMQPVRSDPCDCSKEKRKTKDRQPRPPRSLCYRGSYTETARGLIKKRIEQVPC